MGNVFIQGHAFAFSNGGIVLMFPFRLSGGAFLFLFELFTFGFPGLFVGKSFVGTVKELLPVKPAWCFTGRAFIFPVAEIAMEAAVIVVALPGTFIFTIPLTVASRPGRLFTIFPFTVSFVVEFKTTALAFLERGEPFACSGFLFLHPFVFACFLSKAHDYHDLSFLLNMLWSYPLLASCPQAASMSLPRLRLRRAFTRFLAR